MRETTLHPVSPDTSHAPIPPLVAPRALALALGTGVIGSLLLVQQTLAVNVAVLVVIGLAGFTRLSRETARPLTLGAVSLGALALLFACMMAWRDAAPLRALDAIALLTVLCALVPAVRHGDAWAVERAGPLAYVGGAVTAALRVASGAPLVTVQVFESTRGPRATQFAGAGALFRGAVLATPLLIVFGALLTAADASFARLLDGLVAWELDVMMAHLVVGGVIAWGAAGMAHAALLDPARHEADVHDDRLDTVGRGLRDRLRAAGIGAREVTVALALVDLLFVAFGAMQLRWLFGGASSLDAAGLTVAEYARSGFFELVAVAALVLPLLLLANGVLREDESRGVQRAFRAVAAVMIGLVLVLLVSAADRMRLYQASFGLTELRVYALAFELWLGVVFVWAAVTLLRGKAAPFALGALVSAWSFVIALHVWNPDARIARTNLARAAQGQTFDAEYLSRLSLDAAPVLVAATPMFAAAAGARCDVARVLQELATRADASHDWREWSWSRWRARAALRAPSVTASPPAPCPS